MKALATRSDKAAVFSQRSFWGLQMDSPVLQGVYEKIGFVAPHGVLKGSVCLVRKPVQTKALPGCADKL